jgi:fibro-slime domain-containing protein
MRFFGDRGLLRASFTCMAFAGAAGALGCSAAGSSNHSGVSQPDGSSGSGGIAIGNAGNGTVIMLPPDQDAATPGGAVEDWPSPACKGAIIDALTGQYCQGPAYDAPTQTTTIANDSSCGTTLWGVARDFIGYQDSSVNPPGAGHQDFGSHYCCGNPQGTVLSTLGADGKPAYNPANAAGDYSVGVGLTGPDAFAQWYNDTAGINLSYLIGFHLVPSADGLTRVYSSKLYFPLDGVGFGNFNDYGEDGKSHNFGFTTELHTKFKYQGGETFAFEGDDDLWVFINKQLAIDMGGIHAATQAQVKLDDFASKASMVVGEVYSLDLFQAERHPSGSNFTITTSMTFVDCGIDPTVVK